MAMQENRSSLVGTVQLPGDKSISHRYALLAAAGLGETELVNYSGSLDCRSTLDCLRRLGVEIRVSESSVRIMGGGISAWKAPAGPLDCGNSGTALRLLAGLVAGLPMTVTLTGDASLSRRPMARICRPLREMGARISARSGDFPPLQIQGAKLSAISFRSPLASAQVKSCILLAGLNARGVTRVAEPSPSRDHTERALPAFGIDVKTDGDWIVLHPGTLRNPPRLEIPGDVSAATFFITGALLAPGSQIQLNSVGTNPSRSAFLRLLQEAGASIVFRNSRRLLAEPVQDLEIHHSPRLWESFPNRLSGSQIPNLIDEIPALALLGTRLKGGLEVRDAADLRTKECDRIHAIVLNLQRLGVDAREFEDGFQIPFTPRLRGGAVETFGDHRIAMALWLANLLTDTPVTLDDPGCVSVSDPGFFQEFEKARRNGAD